MFDKFRKPSDTSPSRQLSSDMRPELPTSMRPCDDRRHRVKVFVAHGRYAHTLIPLKEIINEQENAENAFF